MSDPNFYTYGNIKVGRGNFDFPPLLIGTIFYQGQTLVNRKNTEIFDENKALKRINTHLSLSQKYKIPNMIEISATTPDAMINYLEFYITHFDQPFVLGGNFESRLAGIEFLTKQGIKPDHYIYNTISNLKNRQEIEILQKYDIRSAVILILGSENMTSTQRYEYITKKNQPNNKTMLEGLTDLGIEKIWVDGGVINLESLAHILETQQLISTSLQIPVGTAPNLFLFQYSSPRLNNKFHTRYRRASIMFIAAWYSNFIFYGAIEDAKESFASAYQSFELKKIIKSKNISLFKE
jgi:tetrahydromethanopterin S-methyltransferase subunit H